MKKYVLGLFATLTAVFVLATGAAAASGDVVVHIMQDFVASGKTLPAGTYKISREITGSGAVLRLRDDQSGSTTFILATTRDASTAEQPKVTLVNVDGVYYLTAVSTELGDYTFAPPSAAVRMAKARSSQMASSGSN